MSENLKSESDLDEKPSKIRKVKRIFSLIEKCKICRLDVAESVKLCNENNWNCTRHVFLKWSEKYEKNTGDRLAEISNRNFTAKPGMFTCKHCDFKEICEFAE